ncbi:hypothetical protein ACN38_g4260 [Penicillium nordicum]|uniref:Protein kinase domain-containing protein n=1 Tax=Penicillium nordicum TaxID=229535 RepID=A0A0M9WH93_9EURO|nr:hypothetical protein ACN38_g4260 [Penicillium nordicum]
MYRKNDILYLVMQLIPGIDLPKLWGELSKNEKVSICEQLRRIFSQLRAIPAPSPSYFGSISGGPVEHRFFQMDGRRSTYESAFQDIIGLSSRHGLSFTKARRAE